MYKVEPFRLNKSFWICLFNDQGTDECALSEVEVEVELFIMVLSSVLVFSGSALSSLYSKC